MAFVFEIKIKTIEISTSKGDISTMLLDKFPVTSMLVVIY